MKIIVKPSMQYKHTSAMAKRNALALLLFMYSIKRETPDLVILDDPISSFDGNKNLQLSICFLKSLDIYEERLYFF